MTDILISSENEIWKPILDCPYYEASNFGRIRALERSVSYLLKGNWINRTRKAKTKSLRKNCNGYYVTDIYYSAYNKRTRTVHTLVMEAFLGPIPNGYCTDHKNGIITDNRLENLEYVEKRENDMRGKNARAEHHHISWNKTRKTYRVRIRINKKRIYAESVNLEKAIIKRDEILKRHNIIISGVKNVDFLDNVMDGHF